jgi:hypothetical protein
VGVVVREATYEMEINEEHECIYDQHHSLSAALQGPVLFLHFILS